MAEETRKVSETSAGLAGESQSSGDEGITSPKDDGTVQFDSKLQYQNPAKPDETISAAELKSLVNQGKMFRDAQSARDKALAGMEQQSTLLSDAKLRADKAEAQLQQIQIDQKVVASLKEVGITGEKKVSDADPWSTDVLQEDSALTPDMVLRRVDEVAKAELAGVKTSAKDIVKQVLADEKAEAESQKRVTDFVQRARQVKTEQLEAELPDIPASTRDRILNLQDQKGQLETTARDLVSGGDLDRADEAWTESQGRSAEALRLHTEALIEQKQVVAEKERLEEIEGISKGGPDVRKSKQRTKKWRWGKAAEDDAKANAEQAIANEKRIAQLKGY